MRCRKLLALALAASMVFSAGAAPVMAYDGEPFAVVNDYDEDMTGIAEDVFLDDEGTDVYFEEDFDSDFDVEDEDSGDFFEEENVAESETDPSGTEETSDYYEEEMEDREAGADETADENITPAFADETGTEEPAETVSEETEETEELTDGEEIGELNADQYPVGAGVGDTASGIKNIIDQFAMTLGKLTKNTEEMTQLEAALERFGGMSSLAGGAIGILQMTGLLKDPTSQALSNIFSEVKNVETQLDIIEGELGTLKGGMDHLTAYETISKRQTAADSHFNAWDAFNTAYTVPLTNAVEDQYTAHVKNAITAWWNQAAHDGIWVCYASVDGSPSLTYSRTVCESAGGQKYALPQAADNGEAILADASFGIPVKWMPDTAAAGWDIDTYENTFIELMAKNLISAANAGELDATAEFYGKWAEISGPAFSDMAVQQATARSWAQDVLNTVIYQETCKKMVEVQAGDNTWVSTLVSKYKNYCGELVGSGTGIDHMINLEYLTHGFEAETKDEIAGIIDRSIVNLGFFSSFVLSITAQDYEHWSNDEKLALQQLWADTADALEAKKTSSLTGSDNYCYFLDRIVSFEQRRLHSTIKIKNEEHYKYLDSWGTGWDLRDMDGRKSDWPDVMSGNANAIILYAEYARFLNNKKTGDSFVSYLNNCGVNIPSDFSGRILTAYNGEKDFPLSAGLSMTATRNIGNKHFETDQTYSINNTGRENKLFTIHDAVWYDWLDVSTGSTGSNDILGARALYHDESIWYTYDEAYVFRQNCDLSIGSEKKEYYEFDKWYPSIQYYSYTTPYDFYVTASVFALSKVARDSLPANSPLTAFGMEYVLDMPEAEPHETAYSKADWNLLEQNAFGIRNYNDDNLDGGLLTAVDEAVRRAAADGITVSLTDTEKKDLAAKLKNRIFALQKEMQANGSLLYRNVFGINGNEARELALAKAVLPPAYFDSEGNLKITAENMDTGISSGAGAVLNFTQKNGSTKAVINSAFEVNPVLIVWNHETGVFESFKVTDDVMEALGLKMNVRISAVSLKDQDSVTVIGPDVREETDILGSGNGRYVSVQSGRGGLFELMATPSAVNISSAEVKLTRKLFTYNGRIQKPGIRVSIDGSRLIAGTDFYLTWSDVSSKDAGSYTVTITGKGKYNGALTAEYKIKKAKNLLAVTRKKAEKKLSFTKLSSADQTVKSSEMMKVSCAEGVVTYQLVSLVPAAYKGYFSINKNTGVITVKKGLPKGSYKLKVRIKAAGTANYNGLSKVVVLRAEVK